MPGIGPSSRPPSQGFPPRTAPKPRGIDPDSEDMSKFLKSCANGDAWSVNWFLDAWPMQTEVQWSETKMTALLCAAQGGQLGIVEILAGKGANLQARNKDGVNALMLAAEKGHENLVKYLLEHGISPRVRDNDNRSPLHHYVSGGDTDRQGGIPALLARHGAYINDNSPGGISPLQWAVTLGRKMVVRALLDIGADVKDALQPAIGSAIDKEIVQMVEEEPARRGQAAMDKLNEGTGAALKISKPFNLSKTPKVKEEPKPAATPVPKRKPWI